MVTLTLPQLVAGRRLAAAAVARLGTIAGTEVVVDATPLTSGTGSFAGQLVQSILVDGEAKRLSVLGGPADFVADLRQAATVLGVADRISFAEPGAGLDIAS
jgi:hypothetical protein